MGLKAIIIGASGHGKVVLSVLQAASYEMLGWLDDDFALQSKSLAGYPVLGKTDSIQKYLAIDDLGFIIAIGNNLIRQKFFEECSRLGLKLLNAGHPSSVIHSSVKIGCGNIVMPLVAVNIDTIIGSNCILNTSCSIDHDCLIEDHVHIAPGVSLAGNVKVKSGAFMGIGSKAIPGITIGKGAIVGAGTVVLNDVPDFATAVGNPGRIIKTREPA
jgi:sugar O-acyltransferase (sialic acid O-acetyltransferase NeuD family)